MVGHSSRHPKDEGSNPGPANGNGAERVEKKFVLWYCIAPIWGCKNNTLFSLQFTNRHSKLECFTVVGFSREVLCNTLAYWAHS